MDVNSYIKNTYELIKYLDKQHRIMQVKSNIDGRYYVLKMIKAYDRGIYDILKNRPISGIPVIYEIIDDESYIYIIEEYIEGKTLDMFFDTPEYKSGNAEWMITHILQVVCSILFELHKNEPPIIHRDVKPDNILVTEGGDIKLLDFNISRQYTGKTDKDTVPMGTYKYAAPEQYGIKETDARSDIYSLGITISELLELTNTTSDMLSSFVSKATEIDPDKRFQSVREVIFFINNYDKYIKTDFGNEVISSNSKDIEFEQLSIYKQKSRRSFIILSLSVVSLVFIFTLCIIMAYKTDDIMYLAIAILIFMFGGMIILTSVINNKDNKPVTKLSTGKMIRITQSICNYRYKKYDVYKKELTRLGFNNIECIALNDLGFARIFKDEFLVDSVTIDGNDAFKPGEMYDSGSVITVLYHSSK